MPSSNNSIWSLFLPAAQKDAQWQLLIGLALILSEPPKMEFYLAFIFWLERAQLQLYHDGPLSLRS